MRQRPTGSGPGSHLRVRLADETAVDDDGNGPRATLSEDGQRATPRPATVLVLTPRMGGYYFGALLAGIAREVAGAGGRLVLVQTPEPPELGGDQNAPGEFATPAAWSQVDGAVVILTTVGGAYLQRLRDAGKPVVLISTRIDGFDAPLALPDNAGGTRAAMDHLIAHGHTRIAFVGDLAQQDVRDRHGAYLQSVRTHALATDPALTIGVSDNDATGGVQAARDVLGLCDRPTAIMVATDGNALGLMRALGDADVRVPDDIAIVAFDNIEAGAFSTPALSSVDQRFDDVGALAGRLVLAQMRGEIVPFEPHILPAALVVLRGSCGCAADTLGAGTGRDLPLDDALARLRDEAIRAISGPLLTGDRGLDDPLRDAVSATVREAEGMLRVSQDVTAGQIQSLTASMRRLTPRLGVLRRITGTMTDYVQRGAATVARARGNAAAGPERLSAALWRLQAGTLVEEQSVVDAPAVYARRTDPRHLDWLVDTRVRAGVLALWEGDPSCGRLRITGSYDPEGLVPDIVGAATSAEVFPPASLVRAARPAERGVCVVIPVRTRDRYWGLLAVVSEIDTSSTLETYHHWVALLCTVFEEEALQEVVRASEQRYALAARATNDGLWEWEARTGNLYLSDRCVTLLGLEPDPQTGRLAQWEALVHPDDREKMRQGMRAAVAAPDEPVAAEYRIRAPDGSYRWMLARALGVPTVTGPVERVVGSLTDIHERRRLEDELREHALHDALTGLPNRRLFLDRLEHSLALWHRCATPFAVLFIDLDGFKAINDTIGHPRGDRVLMEVGARIEVALRTVDTGARLGGDEFAILLHDVELADAALVVQRVQEGFAQALVLDGHEVTIRASIGVTTSSVECIRAEDVLRDADAAMYRAKATGRSGPRFGAALPAPVGHEPRSPAEPLHVPGL